MSRSRLKLVGYSVGQGGLKSLISQFCEKGGGIISSDSGGLLRTVRSCLGPDEDRCQIKTFQELVGWCQSMLLDRNLRVAGSEVQRATLIAACQAANGQRLAEASRWPEFTDVLGETLSVLRGFGVNEQSFSAPQVSEAIRTKLSALFSIESHQLELLHQLKFYKQHEILDTFKNSPILRVPEEPILLIVAEEFRPSVIQWVRNLGDAGVNLTVALEGSRSAPSAVSLVWQRYFGKPEKGTTPVSDIVRALEGTSVAKSKVNVTLVSTPNVSEECDWAIRYFFQNQKSSAVFVAHAEVYNPLMEAAARKHGVNLSAVRSQPLRTDPWVNLLCNLLEALALRRPQLFVRFFASTFNQFSVEFAQNAIEMVRRARGDTVEQLSALEPVDPERDQWFLAVLDWCLDVQSTRQTYLEWVEEIRSLIEVVPWTDSLVEGDPLLCERTSRAQFRFIQALRTEAEVARLSSAQAIDFPDFVNKVRRLVETSTSTVPRKSSDQEIYSDSFSLRDVDHLIVVGATDGKFPSRAAESPLLGDSDMEELTRALSLPNPLPTSSFRSQINRDALIRTLNSAHRSIHLLYPRLQDNRQVAPALIVQRMKTAGITVESVNMRLPSLEPISDGLATRFDRNLNELLKTSPLPLSPTTLQTEEGRLLRQRATANPVDYEAVLSAIECPFRSTMERLRVPGKRRPTVERIFSRIPAEAKLGEQPNRESARKALYKAIDRVIENLRADLSDEVRFQAKVRALALVDNWISVEFAHRNRFTKAPFEQDLRLKGNAPFSKALEPILVEALVDQWFEIKLPEGFVLGARIYDSRSVLSQTNSGNEEDSTELNKRYLRPILAAMIKPEDPSQVRLKMIEYFTPGGMVYFWRKTKPNKDSNSGPNVDKDLDKLAEFAMRVLREASEVLRSFSIEPRPSPKVCQFCSYAELCRSSPGLRDSPDTFEETA